MQGKRVEDFKSAHELKPGEYSYFPYQKENYWWPGKPYMTIRTPNGIVGNIETHQITVHEDGSVTVSPSILCHGENGWHGYLERGIWREC